MQRGMNENELEKKYQSRFNLQWAWADSIATEVKQTYSQLATAKNLNIARIKEQINKKIKKAKEIYRRLSKLKVPTFKQQQLALGLKSKLLKIKSLKDNLKPKELSDRLHICFGKKKLHTSFNSLKYLLATEGIEIYLHQAAQLRPDLAIAI